MKLAALILAAGKSERMGEPKALVRFHEKSFLATVRDNLLAAGFSERLVVLGHEAELLARRAALSPSDYVVNREYERGQFSSFQIGLSAVAPRCDAVLLALVDQPQIPVSVFLAVKDAFAENADRIIIPVCAGKRGHPTLFPESLFEEIIAAPADSTAANLIRQNSALIREVEVGDERILLNLNTKAQLQAARQRSESG